jgi:hypothetical protein
MGLGWVCREPAEAILEKDSMVRERRDEVT